MSNDDLSRFNAEINALVNERVTRIYVQNNHNEQKLVLDLDSEAKEFAALNDTKFSLNLAAPAVDVLNEIVTKEQSNLIQCANDYHSSGRDFYFFLYDLVSLSWYLEKLSGKFDKLKKINPTEDELLHNRIHAQLAFQYQTLNYNLEFEKQNSRGRIPDLHVNGEDIEIKTIITPIFSEQQYVDFSKSFRNSHDSALSQIDGGGMIVVGVWSQRMNNVLKEYFLGLYNTKVPAIQKDTTVLVLEGNKVFEDYYLSVPSHLVKECIRDFAESGYKRANAMGYMSNMSREGFPHGRQMVPRSSMLYFRRMG